MGFEVSSSTSFENNLGKKYGQISRNIRKAKKDQEESLFQPTEPISFILLRSTTLGFYYTDDRSKTMSGKRPRSPPPGYAKVRGCSWEGSHKRQNRPPVNGHTGIYAYHHDDCMCGLAGWYCFRDGHVWSCCGQTEKYCMCANTQSKRSKK